MSANEVQQRTSISNASSYEEIGEFWDTHSLADYWDQTYQVEMEICLPRPHRVNIEAEMFEHIGQEARHRGVSSETLINLWIAERLQPSSISQPTTLEEMAEFWETHDTADYWDQLEEVQINVQMKPRHRVVIEEETYARVAEESRRRGMMPETLINVWVAERLQPLTAMQGKWAAQQQGMHPAVEMTENQLAEESASYLAE